ncbi:2-amino-4-hydroxy-6-hydroxymethyldihydropteridine diphosphokinase [Agromyces sp. NPDC058136]|uniref:2-amino-4-hydroxy-6- hydroxymethyldihydropteridine diphosphokinase n=1 Tax=Agromyces sp. NPDC058136 TaxID=3346354 RepID=UPI0036D89CA3
MSRAVVAFGANLGDREQAIAAAARALADAEGVELLAVSPLYETPALKTTGVDHDAPGYLNGVLIIETALEPHALLDVLQRIETEQGRVRAERWGDRTLDLDLIDFDGRELHDERLELPHPRAWQRAFVLAPWLDLDPDAVLPGRGGVAALRAEASDVVVRR